MADDQDQKDATAAVPWSELPSSQQYSAPGSDPAPPATSWQSALASATDDVPESSETSIVPASKGGGDDGGGTSKYDAMIDRYIAKEEETAAQLPKLYKEKEDFTKRFLDSYDEDRKRILGRPLPDLQAAPKAPQAQFGQGAMEWMQMATVLGALAGGFARRNTTAALNAFGSAIQGFTQGKEQQFKTSLEEWKAASTKVINDNQAKIDRYNMIWKNDKLDMDTKMGEFKIAASIYDDPITYNMAEQKRYQDMAMMLARQEQMQEMLKMRQESLGLSVDRFMLGGGLNMMQYKAWLMDFQQKNGRAPNQQEREQAANRIQTSQSFDRTMGGRAANIATIEGEMKTSLPLALQASQAFPRNSKWVPVNKLVNQGAVVTSDPQYAQLATAALDISEKWAKSMNPQGVPRQDLQDKALARLSLANSSQAFAATLQQLAKEIDGVEKGIKAAMDQGIDLKDIEGEDILRMQLDRAARTPPPGLGAVGRGGAPSAPVRDGFSIVQ